MSVNKYLPHVLVIPEDDANRQIAVGFRLMLPFGKDRRFDIRPLAEGWSFVRKTLLDLQFDLRRFPERRLVGLLDFDGRESRREEIGAMIDAELHDRIFILGSRGTPEELRRELGSFETIGKALARDCAEGSTTTWSHPLLSHNTSELERMRASVTAILFDPST